MVRIATPSPSSCVRTPELLRLNGANFEDDFSIMPSHEQRRLIAQLEYFLSEVEQHPDDSIAFFRKLGVTDAKFARLPPSHRRERCLGTYYWILARAYRYSRPSRIGEAVDSLRKGLAAHGVYDSDTKDVVPMLYLSVALSKVPGEEQKAVEMFHEAVANVYGVVQFPFRTLLWTRGHISKLMRRMGEVKAAEQQEQAIRDYILSNLHIMPLNEYKHVVNEYSVVKGHDYVFDHPSMSHLLNSTSRIGVHHVQVHTF